MEVPNFDLESGVTSVNAHGYTSRYYNKTQLLNWKHAAYLGNLNHLSLPWENIWKKDEKPDENFNPIGYTPKKLEGSCDLLQTHLPPLLSTPAAYSSPGIWL